MAQPQLSSHHLATLDNVSFDLTYKDASGAQCSLSEDNWKKIVDVFGRINLLAINQRLPNLNGVPRTLAAKDIKQLTFNLEKKSVDITPSNSTASNSTPSTASSNTPQNIKFDQNTNDDLALKPPGTGQQLPQTARSSGFFGTFQSFQSDLKPQPIPTPPSQPSSSSSNNNANTTGNPATAVTQGTTGTNNPSNPATSGTNPTGVVATDATSNLQQAITLLKTIKAQPKPDGSCYSNTEFLDLNSVKIVLSRLRFSLRQSNPSFSYVVQSCDETNCLSERIDYNLDTGKLYALPICLQDHWIGIIVDRRKVTEGGVTKIYYYNSFGKPLDQDDYFKNAEIQNIFTKILSATGKDPSEEEIAQNLKNNIFVYQPPQDKAHQQNDGTNCEAFVLEFFERFAKGELENAITIEEADKTFNFSRPQENGTTIPITTWRTNKAKELEEHFFQDVETDQQNYLQSASSTSTAAEQISPHQRLEGHNAQPTEEALKKDFQNPPPLLDVLDDTSVGIISLFPSSKGDLKRRTNLQNVMPQNPQTKQVWIGDVIVNRNSIENDSLPYDNTKTYGLKVAVLEEPPTTLTDEAKERLKNAFYQIIYKFNKAGVKQIRIMYSDNQPHNEMKTIFWDVWKNYFEESQMPQTVYFCNVD